MRNSKFLRAGGVFGCVCVMGLLGASFWDHRVPAVKAMGLEAKSGPSLELVGQVTGVASVVQVVGTMAYVGSVDGLYIVDVSDPTAPKVVGVYPVTLGPVLGVAVEGQRAYVAWGVTSSYYGGLEIVDVSTPGAPAC